MTDKQRVEWDTMRYKRRLEANRSSNYEYWTDKHYTMLENGYKIATWFMVKRRARTEIQQYTYSESIAKEIVEKLRSENNYARIVCGMVKNVQRTKTYSVIYKPKKSK